MNRSKTNQPHRLCAAISLAVAAGFALTPLSVQAQDDWTRVDGPVSNAHLEAVAFGAGKFVVAAAGSLYYATSPGVWSTGFSGGVSYHWEDVVYGGGKFVAVGVAGDVATSDDGTSWDVSSVGSITSMNAVTYSEDLSLFVTVGAGGKIYSSPDGEDWTQRFSSTANLWNGVAYGNGTFVAVGGQGDVKISSDGVNWTTANSGTSNILEDIAFGNGEFHAVGYNGTQGIVRSSANGSSWIQEDASSGLLNGVAFGNDIWIAVGRSSAYIYGSGDGGANWDTLQSNNLTFLEDVSFGNGTFVAVGSLGDVFVSESEISFSPSSFTLGSAGSSHVINVSHTFAQAKWAISASQSWITIDSPSFPGTGNGSVLFTVSSNNTGSARSGFIQIGPATVSLSQSTSSSGGGGTTPPATPTGLSATVNSANSITVSWNDVTGESFYRLERSDIGSSSSTSLNANTTTRTFTGLSPQSTHSFRVQSVNSSGTSAWTSPVSATTFASPVGFFTATAVSHSQIDLSWGSGPAGTTGFVLERKQSTQNNFSVIANPGASELGYQDFALPNSNGCITYHYRITPQISSGTAEARTAAAATPLRAPSSVTASATSATSIFVDWANVTGASSYRVESRPSSGSPYTFRATATTSSFNDTGLSTTSRRWYRVRAVKANGEFSAWAYPEVQPTDTHPANPTSLTVSEVKARSVRLHWSSVSGETGFEIERFVTDPEFPSTIWTRIATPATNSTSHTVTNLVPGWEYVFRVRAAFPGGTTGYSNNVTVRTLPAGPVSVTATALSSTSIQANWSNVPSASGYDVDIQREGQSWVNYTTPGSGTTSQTATLLQTGTNYRFRVRSLATAGNSDFTESDWVATLPGVPQLVTATAVAADLARVTWNSVTGATHYDVQIKPRGGLWLSVASVDAPGESHLQTVSEQTRYSFRVRAVNESGSSSWSSSNEIITPFDLDLLSSTTRVAKLSWTNLANELAYALEISNRRTGPWTLVDTTPGNRTTLEVEGLTSATRYYFRVTAAFSRGITEASEVIEAVTMPNTPTGLVASQDALAAVELAWNAVARADTFVIERSRNGGSYRRIASLSGNTRRFRDSDVGAGAAYSYRLRAYRFGVASASATTSMVFGATAPSALAASAVSTSRIQLGWELDGPADRIVVERLKNGAWIQQRILGGTATSYTVSALPSGTEQRFRVFTILANVESSPSNEASATTWTAIEGWRQQYFETTLNSGDAADDVDADDDGTTNIEEFFHDTDPTTAQSKASLEPGLIELDGELFLVLAFPIRSSLDDVRWSADGSDDLHDWEKLTAGGFTGVFTEVSGGVASVFVPLATQDADGKMIQFFRLSLWRE